MSSSATLDSCVGPLLDVQHLQFLKIKYNIIKTVRPKKKCLLVLVRPTLIFEIEEKVFTVQKNTDPNLEFQKKVFFIVS